MWSVNISISLTLALLTEVKPQLVWDLPASATRAYTPLSLKRGIWLCIRGHETARGRGQSLWMLPLDKFYWQALLGDTSKHVCVFLTLVMACFIVGKMLNGSHVSSVNSDGPEKNRTGTVALEYHATPQSSQCVPCAYVGAVSVCG